jgi:integrase/recombinase XerD
MNKEKIHIPELKTVLEDFTDWLKTLSYSEATVITRERNIFDFLVFLQKNKITSIKQVTNKDLDNYINYQKQRKNKIYKSGLKISSINVAIASINKLFEYFQKSGKHNINLLKLPYLENNQVTKNILTTEEIRQIITSSYTIKQHRLNPLPIGQRDRAMIAVYYACGLRKSEGINLKISDILFERKLLHVKKGKGNKERYVPVTAINLNYIKEYISDCRKLLLSKNREEETEYLFVNQYGQKCGDQSLSNRLRALVKNTGNPNIINKEPTLHSLRHSIATHLLQQGMEIEMIQKFLGHRSLESTQIYTHLANEF